MGQTKQLMPFADTTILEKTIDHYLNSKAAEVVVVLGHEYEKISSLIGNNPVRIVCNRRYAGGMSTSLIAGLNNIRRDTAGIMVALGDQPFVRSFTINLLIDEFERHNGILIPVWNGKRGHPIIFPSVYITEILSLKGDAGAREIIKQHPGDVHEVPVDSDEICLDIDTAEGYKEALARLNGQQDQSDGM